MPLFPQYQNGVLITGANAVSHTSTASAALAAAAGDVHIFNTGATGNTLALPLVATGGPVKVVNIHATATIVVSPNAADASATVNGGASYTVPAAGTGASGVSVTFWSPDGLNWYS